MDLTNPANATLIDTNAQELTGDWRGYTLRGPKASVKGPIGKAPPQEFGEQLYASQPSPKAF